MVKSKSEGLPEGIILNVKDVNPKEIEDTSEKVGKWVENDKGVLEFVAKKNKKVVKEVEIAQEGELEEPVGIDKLRVELGRAYGQTEPEPKSKKAEAIQMIEVLLSLTGGIDLLEFQSLPKREQNLLRRQLGLPDRLILELQAAIKEKDAEKIRKIQDSMKPKREIDFSHADILRGGLRGDMQGNLKDKKGNSRGTLLGAELEGSIYDEEGNVVDENWQPPKSRKKFGER